MTSGKYSKALTILLIVAIIGILGLFVFIGIDIYNKYYLEKETSQGVAKFDEEIPNVNNNTNTMENNNGIADNTTDANVIDGEIIDPFANMPTATTSNNSSSGSNSSAKKVMYKGFVQVGTIAIPRTGLNCPILEKATKKAIEVAIGVQVGPGVNKVGNTVLAGHNYRNGTLFSDNKNIQVGDKINIKDTSGQTITYIVYEKFETTPEDASYINRDTQGKREVTLYSCNDDSSMRIIIKAREQ